MSERRKDAIAIAAIALVPALLFLDVLLGFRGFYVRDVLHYYFPAKKVLREIVLGGHFPDWNPWFAAGQPMAANPEHEVFYPLTWLILLPDFPYAFQLLPLLHVFIAAFTMYALLRSMELGRTASVLGAISFSIGGLLCSMLILFPYLLSIAWLPLTCLYARRFLLHRVPRDFALAALFLGIQLLVGEPTTVFQTGVILGMYAVYRGVVDARSGSGVARRVGVIGALSIVATLIAAVQVLPMLDHFGDTARARGIDYANVSRWSTPFQRLAELVYPHASGYDAARGQRRYWASGLFGAGTNVPFYFGIYSGLLLTAAALAGLLARRRGTALVLALAAFSIVAAAGDHTPLLRLLYDAGIAATLRYPEKFVLILVFAIVVFGSRSLDQILRGDEELRRKALLVTVASIAVAAGMALFSFTASHEAAFRAFWRIPAERALEALLLLSRQSWIEAIGRGLLLLLLFAALQRIRRPLWIALAGLFVVVDLGSMALELAPRVPMAFYREEPPVLRHFPRDRDDFRVFHVANWSGESKRGRAYREALPNQPLYPRNSLSSFLPAAYGLHVAIPGDFDLTELAATDEFTRAAWELEKRSDHWIDVVAAMSNVQYIGVYADPAQALRVHDLREIEPVRFVRGPENPRYYFASEMAIARDRAQFVDRLASRDYTRRVAFVAADAFVPAGGTVQRVQETSNSARIEVEAAGRAFLVMSVTPHRYWRVTLDGRPVQSVVTNLGYQGVAVPAGRHVVEMRYRNPRIALGAAVSLLSLAGVAVFCRMRAL